MTPAATSDHRVDAPNLFVVATPIGNLGDISPRAAEVLSSVSVLLCEDTRRTGRLLAHLGINAPRLVVCNEHTERHAANEALDALAEGRSVALVSDAGTPAISDPGGRITRACIDAGHPVVAIPGPVAAIAALVISGLATDRFVVEGFIPRRGAERRRRLTELANETRTIVIYEAPHRLERTIEDLTEVCGPDRRVAVARELTKRFEEVRRGTLGSIELGEPRGEYVIVLAGAPTEPPDVSDEEINLLLREARHSGSSTRDAVDAVAAQLDQRRKRVYALALELDAPDPKDDDAQGR